MSLLGDERLLLRAGGCGNYSLLRETVELSLRARGHVEFWWLRACFFGGRWVA